MCIIWELNQIYRLNKKEKYTDTQKVYKPVLKEVYNE